MEIRPVRSKADHEWALGRIEALWDSRDTVSDSADELDVLITLVQAWESQHEAILPPDPLEAIAFRLEQLGLGRSDLTPILGSRSRVSEVLARRRPLTLAMIRRLRDGLGLSADVLVGGATAHDGQGPG